MPDMEDLFAKRNYYNEKGRLLIAKGQRLTDKTINLIKKIESEESMLKPIKQNINLYPNAISTSIEDASVIVNRILFESKTKPWRLYLNTLSNYIDWLYTHSIDVALISLKIAIVSGYNDPNFLSELGLGALLHDIGMILVPKAIVLKTENLSRDEQKLIRQHCEMGMYAIKSYNLPSVCKKIISQHHERMDGSGYPLGLSGDEIHDAAKIVMIAEVLDAITSYRPYKSAREIKLALEEIKSDSGKFAYEYVSALVTLLS